MSEIKGLAHIGVMVRDMEKTTEFYQEQLGMELFIHNQFMDGEKEIIINFFKKGSLVLECIHVPENEVSENGCIAHIAMAVEKIEEVKKSLEQKGIVFDGEIVFDPKTGPNGCKYATFKGPNGEGLEINEML